MSAQPLVLSSHNWVCHIVEDSPTASRTDLGNVQIIYYLPFCLFLFVGFIYSDDYEQSTSKVIVQG